MLVSVHLPKTAGSSFFAELNRHFDNQVVNDVADLPLHKPAWQRRANALKHRWFAAPTVDIACVHGHFLPYKYAGAENATFIVMRPKQDAGFWADTVQTAKDLQGR